MKFLFPLLLLLYSIISFGANQNSGAHHPSPFDLIAPFINFAIFITTLVYLLRKPIIIYFHKKSDTIKETLNRAEVKTKESKLMLDAQKKKLYAIEDEIDRIKLDSKKEIEIFKKNKELETLERINNLQNEGKIIVENEKKHLIKNLNDNLIDFIADRTREIIAKDAKLKDEINQKSLNRLAEK